jgi:sirohydrochlorin ferrochelatase
LHIQSNLVRKKRFHMKTAILIMAHGSRVAEANDAVREIAAMVKDMSGQDIVEVSFREQHLPNIQQGIDACVAQGADRVLLIPYFLFVGAHVREDLPEEMAEARNRHPGVEFAMGNHLGAHRKLAEIVVERIGAGLTGAGWQ